MWLIVAHNPRLHARKSETILCGTITQGSPHHHHRAQHKHHPGNCVALEYGLHRVYNGAIATFNSPSSKKSRSFRAFSVLHKHSHSHSYNISFKLLVSVAMHYSTFTSFAVVAFVSLASAAPITNSTNFNVGCQTNADCASRGPGYTCHRNI